VTDDLEARLRRADPAGLDAPIRPADGPDAGILRRTIMDMDDEILTADSVTGRTAPPPFWRRPIVLGAIGAAAAAAVVITVVALTTGDDPVPLAARTTVTYDMAAGSAMQSCMQLSEIPAPVGAAALGGTVVSVDAEQVVLDVDHWYTGGDADRVQLKGADEHVALDGVEFVVGERYLVTAAEGTVMVCGISGPDTPELEQLYTEWYG
jgi:hypothetical protein